jgi:O-6-methylguanine DNA methyltransferase
LVEIASAKRGGVWFSVALNQNGKLIASSFSDRSRNEAKRSVKRYLSSHGFEAEKARRPIPWAFRELYAFYDGKGRRIGSDVFDFSPVSDFRRSVYEILLRIPRGRVTTYGAIAKQLGGKRYSRAVGTAVATNPYSPLVPCHRVVPVSFKVGNYGMGGREPSTGAYMKERLLEREGVKFQAGRVSRQSNWNPN